MKETKIERAARFFARMEELGFSYSEAQSLRRIEMTLHRWAEKECGDGNEYASWAIERDEKTEKPYLVTHYHNTSTPDKMRRTPIADREKGALDRLAKIMAKHPGLWFYHQGDPRGCALYVGRKSDIPVLTRKEWLTANPVDKSDAAFAHAQFRQIDSNYTRGVAVCF